MWQRFITIAAIASLALAVVAGALWVRASYVSDLVRFHAGSRSFAISTDTRSLIVTTIDRPFAATVWEQRNPIRADPFWESVRPRHRVQQSGAHSFYWLGFRYISPGYRPPFFDDPGSWHTTMAVPFYALLAAASLLPAWRLRGSLKARARVRCGQCVACGYDIRVTPNQCPECGTSREGRPAVNVASKTRVGQSSDQQTTRSERVRAEQQ